MFGGRWWVVGGLTKNGNRESAPCHGTRKLRTSFSLMNDGFQTLYPSSKCDMNIFPNHVIVKQTSGGW